MITMVEPVTGEVLAEHRLVAPGETSIVDDHYGGPRPDRPHRAPRPRTQVETDFLALGPVAEAFLVGAAAAGVSKLGAELAEVGWARPRRRRGWTALQIQSGRQPVADRDLGEVRVDPLAAGDGDLL